MAEPPTDEDGDAIQATVAVGMTSATTIDDLRILITVRLYVCVCEGGEGARQNTKVYDVLDVQRHLSSFRFLRKDHQHLSSLGSEIIVFLASLGSTPVNHFTGRRMDI